ncbi:START domain protein [Toxoplasma gondii VAND]|uniref:START domain protein n=1 Tax=Toxoplasma gondii VAND TaxID=933077 RepID=A0A086QJU5_TOXGO|nr:START domain protein [Toxoplasma gondii VAND]
MTGETESWLFILILLRQGRVDHAWEPLLQGPPVTVWRRLIPGTNVHDYFATGEFSDISASAYNTTFSHLPFRASWDDSVVEIRVLEVNAVEHGSSTVPVVGRHDNTPSDEANYVRVRGRRDTTAKKEAENTEADDGVGSQKNPEASRSDSDDDVEEIIYWRVKLPWPLIDRDFVYARRFRMYPESHAIVSVQQATESPQCPEGPQAVRVESYNSTVVLFADNNENDINKKGVSYVFYHFDASSTPVPPWVKSYFTSHTLPRTIAALHDTAKALVGDDGTIAPDAYADLQKTLKFHDVHRGTDLDEEADEVEPESCDNESWNTDTMDDSRVHGGESRGSPGSATNTGETEKHPPCAGDEVDDGFKNSPEGQLSESEPKTSKAFRRPGKERSQDIHCKESRNLGASSKAGRLSEALGSGRDSSQEVCIESCQGTAKPQKDYTEAASVSDENAIARAYKEIWKGAPCSPTSFVAGAGCAYPLHPEARSGFRGLMACVGSCMGKIRVYRDKMMHSRVAAILQRDCDSSGLSNSTKPTDECRSTPVSGTSPSWCRPSTGAFVETAALRSHTSTGLASEVLSRNSPAVRAARALSVILDAHQEAEHSSLAMRPSLAWPWWRYDRSRNRKVEFFCEKQSRLCYSCTGRTMRCSYPGEKVARRDGGAWDNDNPLSFRERLRRAGVLSLRTYAAVEALRWAARLGVDPWRDAGELKGEMEKHEASEKGSGLGNTRRSSWIDELLVDVREDLWPDAILSSVPLHTVRRSPG